MKPYLAILYDSLIESLQSRVLWILLACWTLILIALFPLSISEGESYQVRMGDISSPKTVLDQLAAASAGKGTRAQRSVYAKIKEDFQAVLQDRQRSGRKIPVGSLIASLNDVVSSDDLYDEEAWPNAKKRKELRELIEKGTKSPEETQKLNRRLLDLAFPGSVKTSSGQATWITYAGLKFTDPLPFTARQMRPFIESSLFPLIMWIGLGQIAMMVAIVITSSMIPDMFQTGSLHLLLSKPLSRSVLFLSKYLGGCIFVAINIAFLVIGLYFYAGIQLDIWNRGILWCIPLFIFAFMIFYSVSALVGLIWKNPIICVVVTALFWGACFTVGLIRGISEGFLKGPPTIQRLIAVGDQPVAANQQGRILFWNESQNTWQTAYGEVNGQRVLGPIWDPKEGTLYFGRPPFLPFGITTGESIRLETAKIPEWAGQASTTDKKVWDDSRLDSAPDLPADTFELIPWEDSFLAVNGEGIYVYDREAAAKAEQQKVSLFGFDMKLPTGNETYKRLTEPDWGFRKPLAVAVSPSKKTLVVASRGKLGIFQFDGKKLTKAAELELDVPPEAVINVAMTGDIAIACPNALTPILVDLKEQKVLRTLDEIGVATIKRTASSDQGFMALLSIEGDLWLASAPQGNASEVTVKRPAAVGQGEVSTMSFDDKNRLWVAHHIKQVDAWDLAQSNQSVLAFRPNSSTAELIYNYIINPFYLLNPKPSAINETIQYVLRNPENKIAALDRNDLEIPQIARDPWQPLWSNGLFIAVMLAAGCWYLYRQDL
jgi:ABC-type transport system involved in multi-copper enzyme maturation permease subunit